MGHHPLPPCMGLLLVGFDGSPPARRALEHAIRRAAAAKDEIVLLNVLPPSVRESSLANMMPAGIELPAQMSGTFLDHARERIQEVVQEAQAKGVQARGIVALGEPAPAMLQAAKELQATEIVIGHRSYEKHPTLGPNATEIVMRAPVPVTVVP